MKKIIHIPHSSIEIPENFMDDYIISNDDIILESILMKDDYVDVLVEYDSDTTIIKFPYSRIFCDVERFETNEIMDIVGMGILYTHNHNLKLIRKIKNKNNILKYYYEHHKKLNNITSSILKNNNDVFILDLHSYSNKPLKYELNKHLNRPDICLGVDFYHNNKKILKNIIYKIKKYGYTYSINEPFIGTLIPSDYYLKDKSVQGIMIEINQNIFENGLEKIKRLLKWIITEI